MRIDDFIREEILIPRLKHAGCLVVYDPDHRYWNLCLDLASDEVRVIDASESSIESREVALQALREVGHPDSPINRFLIYVPAKKPETEEEMQVDPFALYMACGSVFPQNDGDEYLSLCLKARPDHATEIRRVFTESPAGPSFAVIDAIGTGGGGWPQLRAALQVDSSREILFALLVPTDSQSKALRDHEGWTQEVRAFLESALEMTVKTRSTTWSALADELWRYVLFSEFVFDLQEALPEALRNVPCARIEARFVIEDVCERLRVDPRSRPTYIERAEAIERELHLAQLCAEMKMLGERDTFPFEERAFLRAAITGMATGDTDAPREVLARHKQSVWLGKGESQAQWELVRAGIALIEACDDLERQLPDHSETLGELLDFYVGNLREADRLHREFEQAVSDFPDPTGLMSEVTPQARSRYSRLAEAVQSVFVRHVEAVGWPPAGRLANADTFNRMVADRLKENGRKVALLMIDGLRFELGVALEKLLTEDGPVELQVAFAQMPSVTLVGMASLLPGGRTDLSLSNEGEKVIPKLAGAPVGNVNQRMEVLRKRYGDRFAEIELSKFVQGRPQISEIVDLLVLRSTSIDHPLESTPEMTLGLIPKTLKLVRAGLHKLRKLGFNEAVIVTDHGFYLNTHTEAGNVCSKPQGRWVNVHERMLLGTGTGDDHNVVVSAEYLGIRGEFDHVAFPRTMAPYRAGQLYFHGGISLPEAVVPVIVARLDAGDQTEVPSARVELSYKNGATLVTTRLPVFEVTLVAADIFSLGASVEILLEAHNSNDQIVGEPRPGPEVNPATRTITLASNERKLIPLRMDPDFEGEFTVKALNPATLTSYCALTLETEYTV